MLCHQNKSNNRIDNLAWADASAQNVNKRHDKRKRPEPEVDSLPGEKWLPILVNKHSEKTRRRLNLTDAVVTDTCS